jgi:hypothetical protein
MNTDKHRFYVCKRPKEKRHIWMRMNTDTHRSFLRPPFPKGSREKIERREAEASLVALPRASPAPPFPRNLNFLQLRGVTPYASRSMDLTKFKESDKQGKALWILD